MPFNDDLHIIVVFTCFVVSVTIINPHNQPIYQMYMAKLSLPCQSAFVSGMYIITYTSIWVWNPVVKLLNLHAHGYVIPRIVHMYPQTYSQRQKIT